MYKDRVMNDKKDFEIPALLSSVKRENLEQVNSKYYIQVLNFPASDFLVNVKISFCHSLRSFSICIPLVFQK